MTLWSIACQAPLSIGISRQKYWSGLECHGILECHSLLQGIFLNPGIKPVSLMSFELAGGFFTSSATWEVKGSTALLFSHLHAQEVLCLCLLFLFSFFLWHLAPLVISVLHFQFFFSFEPLSTVYRCSWAFLSIVKAKKWKPFDSSWLCYPLKHSVFLSD